MKASKLLIIAALATTVLSSCNEWRNCPRAKGEIITEDRQLNDFQRIDMRTSGDVFITVDSNIIAPEVRVRTHESIMENVATRVIGGRLIIETDPCVRRIKTLNVYIVTNDLSEINISGSADIHGQNVFVIDDLALNITGSGSAEMTLEAEEISASISGSGDLELVGTSDIADYRISGSGDVKAFGLETEETYISISGSGSCDVDVSDFLSADISGSGDVVYQGQPRTDINISGSGDVSRY